MSRHSAVIFWRNKFKKLLKNNHGVRNCETLLELSKIKAVCYCKLLPLKSTHTAHCACRLQTVTADWTPSSEL